MLNKKEREIIQKVKDIVDTEMKQIEKEMKEDEVWGDYFR